MYNAVGSTKKDQLVQQFAPLVKRTAYHLMMRFPSSVQVDDLIQNGMIGLLDAIDRFEAGMGAQFQTYAVQRIRGAMLDGVRENDWLPRGIRREFRKIEGVITQLEQEYGRPPSENELAKALGVSLAEYQKMLQDARGYQLVSFEDLVEEGDGDFLEQYLMDTSGDPSRIFENKNLVKALIQGIEMLPEREKLMMALYYERDLNLREIGDVMGVSESRVCQLHTQAVARLRARVFGESGIKKKVKKNG